jgi:hypothetical protein
MSHYNRSACKKAGNKESRPETTETELMSTTAVTSTEVVAASAAVRRTTDDLVQVDESNSDEKIYNCQLCPAGGWKKLVSLSQHMRHRHMSEYNASIEVGSKKKRWSKDETTVLAEYEASIPLSDGASINQMLAERFPSRTFEAIKCHRKRSEYRALVQEFRDRCQMRAPSSTTPSPSPLSTRSSDGIQPIVANNGGIDANNEQENNNSNGMDVDNTSSTTPSPSPRENVCVVEDARASPNIRDYIRENMTPNKITLSPRMTVAMLQYVNDPSAIDTTNGTLEGIHEALASVHPPRVNEQGGRTGVGSENKRKSLSSKKKAQKYAHYQRMFKADKSKLAAEIFDSVDTSAIKPPLDDAYEHFRTIWETTTKDAGTVDESQIETVGVDVLLAPITREEITWAIDQTSHHTAVGPDRVSLDQIKSIAKKEIWCAFNVWLGSRRIPDLLKTNRTALLPKGSDGLTNIKNWRPITIASLLIRLYNKILARRMQHVFHISRKQTGFKPMNGVGQNTSLLHHLLRHARTNQNSIFVCLLDVSKAFDSVPHDSIKRALKRNGCPSEFIDLVVDQYHQVTTRISYGKDSSPIIELRRGVKQGDPMSSILFNLVIDELFEIIGDRFGYEIAGVGSVNARAFADDIALVSGTEVGMQKLLLETEEFLSNRGLELNVKKCIAICLRKAGKVKKSQIADSTVQNPPKFVIKTEPIRLLGVNEQCRYLGVQYTPLGAIDARVPVSELKAALTSLEKAPLKPQQKILMLRSYLIPRFIHAFTYTECYPKLIAQQDRMIRRWLKKILRLPDSLCSDFLYLPTKEGGLGVGKLYNIIGAAKVRLQSSYSRAGDACLKYLVETQGSAMHARWCQAMKLSYRPSAVELNSRKKQIVDETRKRLGKTVHGGGVEVFRMSPITNEWIGGHTRIIRGSTYIRSIQMRTNTIATRVTTTRGQNVTKTCRRCGLADETLIHILQTCPITQGMRCQRHNNVCRKVAEKLRGKGFQVFSEQGIPSPGLQTNISRPDLIATRDGQCLVLDVTCVYESEITSLQDAYRRKVARYQSLAETVKKLYDVQSVIFHGLCIGSRGAYDPKHLAIWHALGFSGRDLRMLAVSVMEDSLRTITLFNNANRLRV